jgi:hypothetical protein
MRALCLRSRLTETGITQNRSYPKSVSRRYPFPVGTNVGKTHVSLGPAAVTESTVRQSGIVLPRYGMDRGWVVAQGLVDLAVDPQLVKQHRQLSRDCNGGSFLGILSFALSQIGPLRLLVLI